MSNVVSIKLVEDNSELVKNATREAIARALETVGMQAEDYAKMLCPVDTGLLRNSITHAVGGSGAAISSYQSNSTDKHGNPVTVRSGSYSGTTPSGNTVYVGTNVEYAPYVEYGTSKTTAQPFIKPAIMDHVSEYRAIAEHELRNG